VKKYKRRKNMDVVKLLQSMTDAEKNEVAKTLKKKGKKK